MRRRSLTDRIRASVDVDDNGCWIWRHRVDRDGYGRITLPTRNKAAAHRIAYETFRGPIPAGLTTDHLCHSLDPYCPAGRACEHRRCVNPWHLEPVTQLVNNARRSERRLCTSDRLAMSGEGVATGPDLIARTA